MPLLNYTTGINANRTISQIMEILANAGATRIMVDYTSDVPPLAEAVTFVILVGENSVPFRLVCEWGRIQQLLKNDKKVPKKFKTPQHALNVGWRIIKVWVEAQMALIEAEQAELPQLFMPHAVGNDGRTLFEHVLSGHLRLGEGKVA